VTYVDKKEAARKCSSGPKGAYNYEEGGEMKEVECGIASNVEKSVEVGAKHTEIRTSLMEVPLQARFIRKRDFDERST